MKTKKYVLGFLFDIYLKKVILIRKHKPAWQAGKLNGVGGKIKPGEPALTAMVREWEEETGTHFTDWHKFCRMKGRGYVVECFVGRDECEQAFDKVQPVTREAPQSVVLTELHTWFHIGNLDWLIPLAKDFIKNDWLWTGEEFSVSTCPAKSYYD